MKIPHYEGKFSYTFRMIDNLEILRALIPVVCLRNYHKGEKLTNFALKYDEINHIISHSVKGIVKKYFGPSVFARKRAL